jgi:hypothetical protein
VFFCGSLSPEPHTELRSGDSRWLPDKGDRGDGEDGGDGEDAGDATYPHLGLCPKPPLSNLRSRPKTTSHFCVRWALPTLLMVSQNDGVIFGQALSLVVVLGRGS